MWCCEGTKGLSVVVVTGRVVVGEDGRVVVVVVVDVGPGLVVGVEVVDEVGPTGVVVGIGVVVVGGGGDLGVVT